MTHPTILTDAQILALGTFGQSPLKRLDHGRAIERAVIGKLGAGDAAPVAVVASDFALFWHGQGPIAPIVEREGLSVGSLLYSARALAQARRQGRNEGYEAARAEAEDLQDRVSMALRKAYSLGQRYWQQADSEYVSHHRKADQTQAKFDALVEETRSGIAARQPTQKEA